MEKDTIAIAKLNDSLRTSLTGGRIVFSEGIANSSPEFKVDVLANISKFDDFNEDNDPHGEHDGTQLNVDNESIFWKIDYYDSNYLFASEAPHDPKQTKRVMTIMYMNEY